MKNTITILFLFLFGACSLHGQFHFATGGQFNFDASALDAQGKVFYEYDDTYRGSGTFTLHFDNVLNWTVDLDGHYKLFTISDDFNFAPLAGLAIINSSVENTLALNLGVFLDKEINEKHFYLEPKLTFRNGTALIVSAGIFW